MTSLLNKLKSLAVALVALSFFAAMTLNSCTSQEQGGDQATESEEHPTESEEEHPADSVDEEHPEEAEEEEGEQ